MDQRQVSILLSAVEQQWRDLPQELRPKAVWICYHDPLRPYARSTDAGLRRGVAHTATVAASAFDVDQITTPLREVWFLDDRGLRKGDVWAFVRFYTAHITQPWCARMIPEKDQVFGRVHEIGIASFAGYLETDDVYLETIWGNLHGRGGRYHINEHGALELAGPQWIS